jgi:hypothetical protein
MTSVGNRTQQTTGKTHTKSRKSAAYAGLVAAGLLAVSTSAAAQVIEPTFVDIVDWDLPLAEGAGNCPGAVGALLRRPPTGQPIDPVYYVTRCENPSINDQGRIGPSVVQFIPGNELGGTMSETPAQWTAWNIGIKAPTTATAPGFTGGMRLSTFGMAFVNTQTQVVRLDLVNNRLTRFNHSAVSPDFNAVSDVAIVERSSGTIIDAWTTHDTKLAGFSDDTGLPIDPTLAPGIVQRLTVSNTSRYATITRWAVDGRAGSVYLSGVAYFGGKIYFSESSVMTIDPEYKRGNSIGVLDPSTHKVRRYSLDDLGLTAGTPVRGPKQITIDSGGKVWFVTDSGHVGMLNVGWDGRGCDGKGTGKAEMTAYLIPGLGAVPSPGMLSVPTSLSPSGGHIGFTESEGSKLGLLIPNKPPVPVMPGKEEIVAHQTIMLTGTPYEPIIRDTGTANPTPSPNSLGVHSDIDPNGEFIEADLPNAGFSPLGILRDWDYDAFWATQFGGPDFHRLTHIDFKSSTVTSAMVTGGGTIDASGTVLDVVDPDPNAWASDGGKANFGFNVYKKRNTGMVRGSFNYLNKVTGEHIKSVTITSFSVSGNTATFGGTCSNNGLPCNFTVTVNDNGHPGKGRDTFNISGLNVVPNGATLNGGNILVRKW